MKDILIYISVVLFVFTVPKIVNRLKIRKYPKSYPEAFFVLMGLITKGKHSKASKILKYISEQTWSIDEYDSYALFYIIAIAHNLLFKYKDRKIIKNLCIKICGIKDNDFYSNYLLFVYVINIGLKEELTIFEAAINLLKADYDSFINKAKYLNKDLFPKTVALIDEMEEVYKTLEYYFLKKKMLHEAGKARRIANDISEKKNKGK